MSMYMDFRGQSYRTSQHIQTSNPRLRTSLVGGYIQALRGILLPRCPGVLWLKESQLQIW